MFVAEDRGVHLSLGRILEMLELLLGFRWQIGLQGVDILFHSRLNALQQSDAVAVFPVLIFFSHPNPLANPPQSLEGAELRSAWTGQRPVLVRITQAKMRLGHQSGFAAPWAIGKGAKHLPESGHRVPVQYELGPWDEELALRN